MSSYQPIYSNRRATATDRVISIEKEPFESAPALSFLNSYEETITANPAFYDPFKPELTEAAPVSYNISRTINTLSDRTIALRHNGNTVDMEISVDTYNYIPKEPIVAPYSPNPKLPKIREGDFYNRSTTTYIYKDVEVPKASNKIWDGRYTRCVDLQGYDVPNGDRLPAVIAEVKSKLDSPTQLYTVLPIAGMATTVAPPKKDPYAATYKVKVQQFIATHYNSLALTRHPKGKAETDLYQELPQKGGDKKFTLQEGFVAAVLDGPYFVRWANVYRYSDTAPDADDDCGHKIIDYDVDGDAIIVLGHLCGKEPPDEIPDEPNSPVNNYVNIIKDKFPPGVNITVNKPQEEVIVIPYINTNSYSSSVPLSPPANAGYGLSALITLVGLPNGTTVYINGQSYNVSNGGIIYDFPLDVVTGQPIVPDSLLVNIIFNDVPSPTFITVVTTFIQPVLPSVQKTTYNTSYRYNSVVTYRMESLLDSNLFEIVTHTPTHPDSIKVESLIIQIQDNRFGLVASGFPSAQAVAGSTGGIEFNAAYYGVNPSENSVSVVMVGNNQIASAPFSFNGTLKVIWLSTEVTELINNQILSIPSNTTLVSDVFIDGVRINPVIDYVVDLDANVVTVYDIATLYKNSVIDIYYFT